MGDLQRHAKEIGVELSTLLRYRDVSKAYENATRVVILTWTHHREVAARPDRLEWLARAEYVGALAK